jgi:DNA-binding MarR family transcriptional regulator
MKKDKHNDFPVMLRKMSKKGFYETLKLICERGSIHYAEILKYDLDNDIVQSRATVTLIVRSLSKMSLVKRSIVDSRPIRTVYQPTDKGLKLMRHLQEIERL